MESILVLFFVILALPFVSAATLIVAHRGASAHAPENTMAAFQEAWRRGADAIEGDFRLTKDGRIVTMHDATTKRTTDRNLTVAETDWATLRKLDAGSWKGEKWRGEKIPLLSEVLAAMPEGKGIFIEVKCGTEIVPRLFEALAQAKVALGRVTIISFDKEVIRAVKQREPRLRANWLTGFKKAKDGKYQPDLDSIMETLQEIGADGLGAQAVDELAGELGVRLRGIQKEYHVWTIDQGGLARRYVAAGAHSVTTNKPGEMRGFLFDAEAAE